MELFVASLTFGLCIFGASAVLAWAIKNCNEQMCEVMKTITTLKAAPDVYSAAALKRTMEKKEEAKKKPKEIKPQAISADELRKEALDKIRAQQSPPKK